MASIEFDKQQGPEIHFSTSQQFDSNPSSGCSYETGIECAPNATLQLGSEDGLDMHDMGEEPVVGIIETVEQLLTMPLNISLENTLTDQFPVTDNNIESMVEEAKASHEPEVEYMVLPTITRVNSTMPDNGVDQLIPGSVRQLAEEIGVDSTSLTNDDINAMMRKVSDFYNSQFPTGYNGEKGDEQYEAMIRNCEAIGIPMPNKSKEEIIFDLTHNNYSAEHFTAMREHWSHKYQHDFPRFVDEMMRYYQVSDRQALRQLLLT